MPLGERLDEVRAGLEASQTDKDATTIDRRLFCRSRDLGDGRMEELAVVLLRNAESARDVSEG
jgi:hypothetical protein